MNRPALKKVTRDSLAGMEEVSSLDERQFAISAGCVLGLVGIFLSATVGLAFGIWPLVLASMPLGLVAAAMSWRHRREHPRIEPRLAEERGKLARTRQVLESSAQLPQAQEGRLLEIFIQSEFAQVVSRPGLEWIPAALAAAMPPTAAPEVTMTPDQVLVPSPFQTSQHGANLGPAPVVLRR